MTPVADPGWYFIGWNDPDSDDLVNVGVDIWMILMNENKQLIASFGGYSMDPVYVDDNFNYNTPGFNIDHFVSIQDAVDRVFPVVSLRIRIVGILVMV